jgi:hypothetical protein
MHFEIDSALTILERTPATLDLLLRGLPAEWVSGREGPETWSPFEVVGHLIHGERTDWVVRAKKIVTVGPDGTFDPFDRFAMFEDSRGKTLTELLDEFATLRRENVCCIRELRLSEADLRREGQHPDFGLVTLRQLLATWVVHDLGHIAQIVRVMAKQYRDEVGPWGAYLPVLTR